MKLKMIVGVLLVLVGAVLLARKIMVKEKHSFDAGPLGEVGIETRKESKAAPIIGGVMLVGGLVLLVAGNRKA